MKRTDVHRPSAIRPQDYELAAPIEGLPWWKSGPYVDLGSVSGVCSHCGHALRYAVRFVYTPTGEIVTFGEDCANEIDLHDSRLDLVFDRLRKRAATERKREQMEKSVRERREQMEQEHPDVVEWMEEQNWDTESFGFLLDMHRAMEQWGSLTENQTNAVRKIMVKRQEQAAAKLNEVTPTTPAPTGRVQVEGEVLSHRYQDSYFGTAHKMLVKLDDGNKVWGTVAESIESSLFDTTTQSYTELRGQRVRFTATFEQSKDDEHFSFFKRPSKAVVV
jgi:hypothetical protein